MVKTVVIGAVNWDVNLFIDTFPRKGEEVVVRRITRVPGGKAGNVAVAAARLLGPNQVAILGAVGKDQVGSEQVRIFKEEGVHVSGLKFSDDVESGQAYITIDGKGENIINTYPGANATISPQDLDEPSRRELITRSSIVTIMDPPYKTALRLAEEARKLDKVIAWDPGVKSRMGVREVKGLLEKVNYVIANESEISQLTGTRNWDATARKLMKINSKLKIIAKLGAKGSVMYHGDKRIASKALDLRSLGMRVVNTVGCGDAFLGAFISALSEDRDEVEALKWGNVAGGLNAARGETHGSPNRETLLKYVR